MNKENIRNAKNFDELYRRTLKMSYLKFKLILSNRCRYYTKQVFVYDNVLVNWYY
jgi:hypothetical protein